MKKLFVVLGSVIALASCKKDSDISPAPTPGSSSVTKKLMKATYVYDNGAPEISEYVYDAEGRLSAVKDGDYTETFNYISNSSLVVTEKKTADNSMIQTKECTLNEKGYITKILFKNITGAITYWYEYTYNAEGFMTRKKGSTANGSNFYEVVFTIVDGNPVSSKGYFNDVFTYDYYATFDNTKLNKTPSGFGGYWASPILFGKPSKNMQIEYKTVNTSGTTTWHTKNLFELDTDGYPHKLTTTYLSHGTQEVDTFIYQ